MSANPINKASDIIDKFGGIRPMANKIGVAVTTVQGWKKRDTIPANRRALIEKTALEHNVDLSDYMRVSSEQAEPAKAAPPVQKVEEISEAPSVEDHKTQPQEDQDRGPSVIASMLHDDVLKQIKQAEGRAVMKANITTIILIGLTIIALAILAWPKMNGGNDNELASLEQKNREMAAELETIRNDMESIKDRQGFFGQIIPDDLGQRLSSIKKQAVEARDSAVGAVEEARTIADEIATGQTEMLSTRMEALERHLNRMGNAPLMSSLVQRYDAFTATTGGQNLLENSTQQLADVFQNINSSDEIEVQKTLDQARLENADLGQSFEGVPPQDLKAAALLMTMTQMRSALNRENEPFASDLELLKNLIGQDNPALTTSIDRLAPHAQSGVLTPAGLSSEFRSITGDVVVASLKGEDVSFQERAKARMNQILKLEKEGELLTGTETQATLNQAEALLSHGELSSAIAQLETIDGEAAEVLRPFIEKAQATHMAEELKATLSGALESRAATPNQYTPIR